MLLLGQLRETAKTREKQMYTATAIKEMSVENMIKVSTAIDDIINSSREDSKEMQVLRKLSNEFFEAAKEKAGDDFSNIYFDVIES